MRKILSTFIVVGFLYIAYGLSVSFWRPSVYSTIPSEIKSSLFYDYSGAINIRTNKSSGSGHFDKVVEAASEANLNFIVTTDFNDFTPDLNRPSYLNNVLTVVGGEYSLQDARILNLDITTLSHLQGPGRSQVVFGDLLSRAEPMRPEGSFVLSHPLKPGYQWSGPYPKGLNGIEIINLKSVWQDAWIRSKPFFIWTALIYPFNSDLAFLRLLSQAGLREMSLWDKLNQQQKVFGIYGSAAEAKFRITNELYINFPSYETVLSIARNHVLIRSELTGNGEQDHKKIAEALRRGQFYMSLDLLERPNGFECFVRDQKNQIYPLSSEIKFNQNLDYTVNLPNRPNVPFEVFIYRNGEKIMTSTSLNTVYTLQGPGSYRSVVRLKIPMPQPDGKTWMNWIVTNPIYVN